MMREKCATFSLPEYSKMHRERKQKGFNVVSTGLYDTTCIMTDTDSHQEFPDVKYSWHRKEELHYR